MHELHNFREFQINLFKREWAYKVSSLRLFTGTNNPNQKENNNYEIIVNYWGS